MTGKIALCLVCVGMALQPALADEKTTPASNKSISEAINNTKPILDVRYRYEWKDQAGFVDSAHANTLRTRFGIETGEFYHSKYWSKWKTYFPLALTISTAPPTV